MNLVLLFPEDFVSERTARLSGERARHIREVHRAEAGKILKVGRASGGVGTGTIVAIDADGVTLEVEAPVTAPETPSVSLLIALPRPQTLKKILEIVGAVGIRRLFLTGAERAEKSFFSSSLLKEDAWKRHLHLGMEQGLQTFVPEVVFLPKLAGAFERLEDDGALRLLLHPEAGQTLWDTPFREDSRSRKTWGAIGPEGGWVDSEIRRFASRGFQSVTLGPTVHRVENAVASLLAQIEFLKLKP